MSDIQTKEDIRFLVNSFYELIRRDGKIGFFFNEVAQINWEDHLPKMYDFWESIVLGNAKYSGNPMNTHVELSRLHNMKPEHFDHWLSLWNNNIDQHFQGENAEEAKNRANQIAQLMRFKVEKFGNNAGI